MSDVAPERTTRIDDLWACEHPSPLGGDPEPTTQRSPRHTREDYLRLARQLAGDVILVPPSPQLALAHVSIADVAGAAGVSRGALYRLWPSQQDFWADLVDCILDAAYGRARRGDDAGEHLTGTGHPTAPRPGATPSGIANFLDAVQDRLTTALAPLLWAAVVSTPQRADAADIVSPRRQGLVAELERCLAGELRRTDTRCVDGVTITDLAAAATTIGNGLSITGRMSSPDELTVEPNAAIASGAPRSLLGAMVNAVQSQLAEPDPSDRDCGPAAEYGPSERLTDRRPHAPLRTKRSTGRREHYLRTATALALNVDRRPEPARVPGPVTLDNLARAAGVTRRALTHFWPNHELLALDLFAHLLDYERQRVKNAIAAATQEVRAVRYTPREAFLALGDRLHTGTMSHLSEISYLAYAPQLEQPAVAQRAAHEHDRHIDDGARLLGRMLSALHRRPRSGISFRQLALALYTVADGTNRLARTHRPLVRDEITTGGTTHSLTGHTTAAIFDEFTDPVDPHPHLGTLLT